jgi:hypothetical protein
MAQNFVDDAKQSDHVYGWEAFASNFEEQRDEVMNYSSSCVVKIISKKQKFLDSCSQIVL